MKVSIDDIQKLRKLTGAGLTDAKKALETSNGNFNNALNALRKKGFAKAEERTEREARSGLIGTYNHDGRIGVLVEVNCETDFVARNENFVSFVKNIAMHIAAADPKYISYSNVTDDIKQTTRSRFVSEAKEEGKPSDMIEKIVEGRLKKYFAEQCLLDQPFVKDPEKTVGDYLKEHNVLFGENIVIRRFNRMALGETQ